MKRRIITLPDGDAVTQRKAYKRPAPLCGIAAANEFASQ
jgi:hypothetical protein